MPIINRNSRASRKDITKIKLNNMIHKIKRQKVYEKMWNFTKEYESNRMNKEGNGKVVCIRLIFPLISVLKMGLIFTKTKNKQKHQQKAGRIQRQCDTLKMVTTE